MTRAAPAAGPRFRSGEVVRVRHEVAGGNPRTPRYVRGLEGVVTAVHGSISNPLDHRGLYPPLYTIRFRVSQVFAGRGEGVLHVDIHEDWLEPA